MAIVIDEHGGTAEESSRSKNLLEEIVGEIADEFDIEAPGIEAFGWRRLAGGAPGRTPIDDVRRGARSSSCPTPNGTRWAGWCSTCSATSREGERPPAVPGTWSSCRRARVGRPAHHLGGDHPRRPRRDERVPIDSDEAWTSKSGCAPFGADGPPVDPLRLRHPGRATQRRQVDAREPARRLEGVDRLGSPADDAHTGAGRAPPPRDQMGAARHAGHPQAAHPARRALQRTIGARDTLGEVDTSCVMLIEVAEPIGARRPLHRRGRAACRPHVGSSSVNKIDVVGTGQRGRTSSSSSWSRRGSWGSSTPFVPLSARTGESASTCSSAELLKSRLPRGPALLPRRQWSATRPGDALRRRARPRAGSLLPKRPRRAAALRSAVTAEVLEDPISTTRTPAVGGGVRAGGDPLRSRVGSCGSSATRRRGIVIGKGGDRAHATPAPRRAGARGGSWGRAVLRLGDPGTRSTRTGSAAPTPSTASSAY